MSLPAVMKERDVLFIWWGLGKEIRFFGERRERERLFLAPARAKFDVTYLSERNSSSSSTIYRNPIWQGVAEKFI